MLRAALAFVLVTLPLAAIGQSAGTAPPASASFYPLKEVHRGQHATAWTVFEGITPEPMDVEILGLLRNAIGPGQDMILARLHGTKPEYTGVVAGMSGSPVYIDGKLLGALSYRIGQFSKEPIAGITPIEQMLQVRNSALPVIPATPAATSGVADATPRPTSTSGEIVPMETSLVFTGFSQDTVALFRDRFTALGLNPVAGIGSASPGEKQPEPIVPGSAVSAVLVDGDLSIAGTCTVTYVDPKQLLACGHPITQYGNISMPMTKAQVLATLSSPLNSFKIVNTTETVGAFTQDRASAILGQFGQTAEMIPVTVAVNGGKPMHFRVLNNRELTPQALLASVYQAIHGTNAYASELSYRVSGTMSLAGYPPVSFSTVAAQTELAPAAIVAALSVNDRFQPIYNSPAEQPTITSLDLKVEALPGRRTAQLEAARLSVVEASPGDEITVETTVTPYQSAARIIRIPVKLPSTLDPGPVRILVSDGATLDRLLAQQLPSSLSLRDTITQLNDRHPNDRVYVTVLDHAAQAVVNAQALPQVPLSIANIYQPLQDSRRMNLNGESLHEAGSAPIDNALTGSQVLTLNIR
ncbi:SpoIVB peptidase S55 domain-containing protein [Terriglobus albidus]|uniref:SpoIVB peptidase S55 domain-containing protein n=1 Tax=Terriglobus albidus TaxID=1592106 RepID=UPI0021E05540|nr:SpoIVB peptidase S55 domain-containing protein [Terriglobus albidus]